MDPKDKGLVLLKLKYRNKNNLNLSIDDVSIFHKIKN